MYNSKVKPMRNKKSQVISRLSPLPLKQKTNFYCRCYNCFHFLAFDGQYYRYIIVLQRLLCNHIFKNICDSCWFFKYYFLDPKSKWLFLNPIKRILDLPQYQEQVCILRYNRLFKESSQIKVHFQKKKSYTQIKH